MKVRRGFVHVQHHVEHMEMGIPLLKALCVLNQSLRCPLAALRTAAAVIQIADLEDGLMEQLLLLALPDMLVVVWDLIPCLFLPGVVCLQCLVEDLMVDLFQIIVAKVTFCSVRLRSTFAAENLRLLCRILPRPVIPEIVVPIKSPTLSIV